MKEHCVTFYYERQGEICVATAFTNVIGKGTRETVEKWLKMIKEDMGLEKDVTIINIFPLAKERICPYKASCPSRSGWCEWKNPDFETCIPFVLSAFERVKNEKDQWRKEAIKMAAAAGEKKIEEFNEKPEGGEKVD